MEPIVLSVLLFAFAGTLTYLDQRTKRHRYFTRICGKPRIEKTDIVFHGSDIDWSHEQLHEILSKRFPYYTALDPLLQKKFRLRLHKFMRGKIFIIKDNNGVKDMPVLVSASAIQLTFGLRYYHLPFFKYVRIYPEEYFSEREFFKVLAGNVQQNVISIAWNHVLNAYSDPADGVNTPLHEMSHALYIQKLVIDKDYSKKFNTRYKSVIDECRKAYRYESSGRKDLYSDYAQTNPQEFWAESVELFFEKHEELRRQYPQVYRSMVKLLNQDPADRSYPLLKKPHANLQGFN
jgi:Mlc titration factor MtfA (ptsG expression regulator)